LLEKRSLSQEGPKAELAVLCFSANKMNIHLKTTSAEAIRHKQGMQLVLLGKRMINTPEF